LEQGDARLREPPRAVFIRSAGGKFARNGDTLIVWKLDRQARSMKRDRSPRHDDAQGRLVFHMFGALAEFERSLIRERTRAGLAAARRAGRTGGRPPKLTDDDIEAAKAMLANPDIGVTQIAHRLGVSPATLYQYMPYARRADPRIPRRLRTAALSQGRNAPGKVSA
jgi:DNA invertase Pin-like site-specific DNA recombinase